MYKLRDWLKLVYALVWQTWSTSAIWMDDQFIFIANSALNMIYNYQWFKRSWQHTKELFNLSNSQRVSWKLLTQHPIRTVDKFFVSKRIDVEKSATACDINCDLEDVECPFECDPCSPVSCRPIELSWILPNDNLCPWQYQVWWWNFVSELWWIQWSIIRVYLEIPVDTLWVTYFRWVKHMKSYDDIIPLPDSFITARAYFVAWHIVPMYGIMMQQQDLNYMSLARKELDSLKMWDNIFHKKVIYDENKHPTVTHSNYI